MNTDGTPAAPFLCPSCNKPRYHYGDGPVPPGLLCTCQSSSAPNTIMIDWGKPTKVSPPPEVQYGWVCARCGTSHAPWVAQCQCPGINTLG